MQTLTVSVALGLDLKTHRLLLFLWLASSSRQSWRSQRSQAVYVMTPNKIDKSLIERIITEGPQAAFYNVIVSLTDCRSTTNP